MLKREHGLSRKKAGKELTDKGFSESYLKAFEAALDVSILRAKALLTGFGNHELQGLAWIRSACKNFVSPIISLNQLCLDAGFNAVCCTRFSIHRFKAVRPGKGFSHNNDDRTGKDNWLDSS